MIDQTIHTIRHNATRKYGPLPKDHKHVGQECAACEEEIDLGDFTALIPLGPGQDNETRRLARTGQTYEAVCALVHWQCATGEVNHLEQRSSGEGQPEE